MVLEKSVLLTRVSATFKRNVLCNWLSTVSSESDVIFETISDKGIITLNRPEAYNALNLSMVNKIMPVLKEWETDKTLILIEGRRAFCAGGDIRSVAEGALERTTGYKLLRTSGTLYGVIANCRIPYIAFIDGIVMGAGMGLSVHGKYRIATEKTVFAMPQTTIGYFPDVGASYVLPRLSDKLGYYLALTGNRLRGTDVLKAGIATHFCSSKDLPDLKDALMECKNDQNIQDTLQRFSKGNDAEFSLFPYLERINQYFSAPTVEAIISDLERDTSRWAEATLHLLAKMSPTSLKIALKAFNLGLNMHLLDCLQMEYRVAKNCLKNKDFYEGARALLIDKDHNPAWSPKTLPEVTEDIVETYFIKPPDEEELFHKL